MRRQEQGPVFDGQALHAEVAAALPRYLTAAERDAFAAAAVRRARLLQRALAGNDPAAARQRLAIAERALRRAEAALRGDADGALALSYLGAALADRGLRVVRRPRPALGVERIAAAELAADAAAGSAQPADAGDLLALLREALAAARTGAAGRRPAPIAPLVRATIGRLAADYRRITGRAAPKAARSRGGRFDLVAAAVVRAAGARGYRRALFLSALDAERAGRYDP